MYLVSVFMREKVWEVSDVSLNYQVNLSTRMMELLWAIWKHKGEKALKTVAVV